MAVREEAREGREKGKRQRQGVYQQDFAMYRQCCVYCEPGESMQLLRGEVQFPWSAGSMSPASASGGMLGQEKVVEQQARSR